jgi:curved DNA-binding protein
VRTGSRVRLAGQGEPGHNSGLAGDLYLIVRVLPNETFEREGDNLHLEAPVDIFTTIAGGEIRIPSLERPLILKIPARTNAGRSFRLRGKDMPHLGDPKTRGDLFARVRLVLPDPLAVKILGGEFHEGEIIRVERGKKKLEFTALASDQLVAP